METMAKSSNLVKSNEVIGVDIKNNNNDSLGEVYEIVLDKLTGQVQYVVMETGSFLGMGGKFIALPWKVLNYNPNAKAFVISLSKDQIKNSPGFDKDNWPKNDNPYWEQASDYYSRF